MSGRGYPFHQLIEKEPAAPFSFPNHLLSKKLLSFNEYPRDNAYCDNIEERVKNDLYGYTDCSPTYYDGYGFDNPTTLDAFLNSSKFYILMAEFQICFESINNWVLEKNIVFRLQSGGRECTAYSVLQSFFSRLQGDTFAQHRTYFYTQGKKNIEAIAVLIREESISLEFRKEVIVLLLDEGNFDRCSGACFSNLSDALEKLKNYDYFLPTGLIKLFTVSMAREVALSGTVYDHRSYSGVLCTYVDYKIATHELHAVNYLCQRLKWDLRLYFFTTPLDPYHAALKRRLTAHPALRDEHYFQYFHEFERRFNATNLVRFMSDQLHEACSIYSGSYYSLQNFIESQLIKLGKDPAFSWAEIFTEEGNLKSVDNFMITIAERLIESGWLEFPQSSLTSALFNWLRKSLSPLRLNFRIYPNNLALSWVKREDGRQAILDVLKTEEGIEWLYSHIFSDPKNLHDLLQNLKDFLLFFSCLPSTQHINLLEKLVSIGFDIPSALTDKLDGSINFIDFNHLFGCLSTQGRKFFVTNYPELLYSLLNNALQKVEHLNRNQVLFWITCFINRIIKAGFRDFSNLCFYKRDLRYEGVKVDSYLTGINFANTLLTDVVFYESISNCHFQHANLQGAKFIDTHIVRANFNEANLLSCKFERAYLESADFTRANLKDTEFLNSSLIGVHFRFTHLDKVNFFKTDILSGSFQRAKLSEVSFKKSDLIGLFFNAARLNQVSFYRSGILGVDFSESDLNKVDFSTSEFVSVLLAKSMIVNIKVSVGQLPFLYKQGISNFSGVSLKEDRWQDIWHNALVSPPDRLAFFSRVINSSNRKHFLCCKKRNFRCLDKEPFEVNREARKEREIKILEWKAGALVAVEKNPLKDLRRNPLDRELLEKKYLETMVLKSELLGLEELPPYIFPEREQSVKELVESNLSETYSNDHASPKMHAPQRSIHL